MGGAGNCVRSIKGHPGYTNILDRNYLNASGPQSQHALKRAIFASDVAVQTEAVVLNPSVPATSNVLRVESSDDQESSLSASDLASILKWSKDISSDINLSSGMSAIIVHAKGLGAEHFHSTPEID